MPPGCARLRAKPLLTMPGQVAITMGIFGLAVAYQQRGRQCRCHDEIERQGGEFFRGRRATRQIALQPLFDDHVLAVDEPLRSQFIHEGIAMCGKVSAQVPDARYARGLLRCSDCTEEGCGAGNEHEVADKLAARPLYPVRSHQGPLDSTFVFWNAVVIQWPCSLTRMRVDICW